MPSKQHNELAGMALTWLNNKVSARGYRGTTEVNIGRGYVADAVALCSFQNRLNDRYLRFSGYEPPISNWKYDPETKKSYQVVRGDKIDNYYACVFEVKVSRSDFLGTFNDKEKHKNRHTPIGSLHWVVVPKGIVKPGEVPGFWGLLEVRGSGLSEKETPFLNIVPKSRMDEIAHDLIWPLEKHRGYLLCKECGAWISETTCNECNFKKERTKRITSQELI